MFNYGIGGQEVPRDDAQEGFADIPANRTLIALQLTEHEAVNPPDLKEPPMLPGIEDCFRHFQPDCEVEFENMDGHQAREVLRFNHLGDFGKNGIVKQSAFLQDLQAQVEEYQSFMRQLKGNRTLRSALDDPEARAAYLTLVQAMLKELEAA